MVQHIPFAALHKLVSPTERPMKVEITFDMNQIQSLASRVAPAPAARAQPAAAAAGAKKGGRQGGNKGGNKKERPTKKSAEELDAEMNVGFFRPCLLLCSAQKLNAQR